MTVACDEPVSTAHRAPRNHLVPSASHSSNIEVTASDGGAVGVTCTDGALTAAAVSFHAVGPVAHEVPWYTDQVPGPVRVMRTAHGTPGAHATPAAGETANMPVGWATIVSMTVLGGHVDGHEGPGAEPARAPCRRRSGRESGGTTSPGPTA